ncbi:MAG: M20/M25/M40 family metallo-hydrolase [Proteobacteria bacterium]|nr:M20/M25/M40 family metallo-hydrolase [Pseudomonadota bacterium]
MKNIFASLTLLLSFSAFSQTAVLTDPWLLKEMGVAALNEDLSAKVAYAVLNPLQEMRLHQLAHARGRCGGYEVLSQKETFNQNRIAGIFSKIKSFQKRDLLLQKDIKLAGPGISENLAERREIREALKLVQKERIKDFVSWFSSFPNRNNKSRDSNLPMQALAKRLQDSVLVSHPNWTQDFIEHDSTGQKSLRVIIPGRSRPNEIVVLGGHADSISFRGNAPGADDNASGSADIVEVLNVISETGFTPERSIHLFFYAGEESGLLGSAEIAESYKNEGKNVVAVMQLDMTSFPGSGLFKFSNMTDFTTPTLRKLIEDLNTLYVGGEVIHSECGYGCSDHASWYRNGFPTVIPFESHMDEYNPNIHTPQDTITAEINFEHSAMFAKLALSYVMEVSASQWRAF